MAQTDGNYREKPDGKLARVSLYLGISGLLLLPSAIASGFIFPSIGIVTLFRTLVMPVSLAAVITGLFVIKRAGAESTIVKKEGRLGFIFGLISLGLAVLIMVGVFLLFLPSLFLSQ
jgi:hypothetical protein